MKQEPKQPDDLSQMIDQKLVRRVLNTIWNLTDEATSETIDKIRWFCEGVLMMLPDEDTD
jgi:hypothetical protein